MIFDRHILQLHANQQGIFGRASLCLCIEPTSFPCGYDVPQRESTGMECFSVLFPAKKTCACFGWTRVQGHRPELLLVKNLRQS